MRVWLIQIGEPLPVDGPHVRLLRTGILAETLVARGAEVVWWTAGFSHETKRHRVRRHASVHLGRRLTLKLLASRGYARNVSLARLWDHAQVARAFSRLAPNEPPPDVIVSGLPTPGLCCAAADYAQARGIPLALDLRDQWPEVFLDVLPKWLRWAGRRGLAPLFRQTKRACRLAAGLIAITPTFLRWGLACARRAEGPCDAVLPLGYKRRAFPADVIDAGGRFWDQTGVRSDPGRLTVCFFGSLGRQFALDTVIEAARALDRQGCAVRFVLCGTGDGLRHVRDLAGGVPNVFLPGRVDAPKIQALMERSDLGLAPYKNTPTFIGAMPNKAAEYLSAGLPLISTLTGGLDALLDCYRCGITYQENNARELAGHIARLAVSRADLEAMAAGAERLFADHFDADKIYPAYVEHLERMVRVPAAPRRAA